MPEGGQPDGDRRAELGRRIAERRARAGRAERTDRAEAPLTEGQVSYWLGWRMVPDRYGRMLRRFEVLGTVEPDRLERAVRHMLEQADALRCSYPEVDGEPRQRLHPTDEVPVIWVQTAGPDGVPHAERSISERAAEPIDLRSTLPTEVHILRVAHDRHRLIVLTHACAIDGWSERVLCAALHEGYVLDEPLTSGVPSNPRFVDLASWEAEQPLHDARDLWKRLFGGIDRLDPWAEVPPGEVATVHAHDLGPATVARLVELAEASGTTVFGVLLAVSVAVLGDEWQLDRPVVDISTAGRAHPDAELVAGRFAQLRPFAGDLRDDPTLRELIGRVGADLLAVLDVTRAPLHQMLAELPLRGSVAFRSVHVQYRAFPRPPIPRGRPWVTPVELRAERDIALEISALPGPDGSLRVITRGVPRVGIESSLHRATDRVLAALHVLADQPDVLDLPCSKAVAFIADVEHPFLPDPDAELPRSWDVTVLDRVRSVVARQPSSVAVDDGVVQLTYAELLDRAERLATTLRRRDVDDGCAVLVLGPRSAGTVVAMLGILLAGGVMVPFPDDLPDLAAVERADVAGASLGVVVGVESPAWLATTVFLAADGTLDEFDADIDGIRTERLPSVGPDAPAYVFFTSGTAGRARSVVGLHGSLCQFLDWQRSTYRIGADDRVALLTSVGFDVVLRNVFLPLTSGGTVVVPPAQLDPGHALRWIAEQQVTVVHVTPGVARSWLQFTEGDLLPQSLRWTFFAGEPLTAELVDRWRGALPAPGNVVNFYGPTETCMVRASYCVPDVVDEGPVPVGWAIPGSQVLVVDEQGHRVGPGVVGEIIVRTQHGTAGYGNAPELWAERAVSGDLPGQVTYRTGDLGWYCDDGALVVQGRIDDEVKVNGVRVQPNDVAERLRRLPGVGAAEVLAGRGAGDEVRLVAAVAPAGPLATGSSQQLRLDATGIRTALGQQLPAAAVPAVVLVLDRLPLTVNGKVDRAALLELAGADAPATGGVVPVVEPEDHALDTVLTMWREVFDDEHVTRTSNFFELGGHSLMALRLLHRLRQQFGVDLSLQVIFAADTPAAMAALLTVEELRLPVTWQQAPYVELHELDPERGRSVLALGRLTPSALDLGALGAAAAALVARHDALRTRFDVSERQQVIAPSATLPIDVIEVDEPPPGSVGVRERCVEAAGEGLRLDDESLVRLVVVRYRSADLVVFVVHHAVVDGVSLEMLADELELAYDAAHRGRQLELAPVTCRADDLVAHQAAQRADGVFDRDLEHWRSVIPPGTERLELPTDRSRTPRSDGTPGQCQLNLRPTDRHRLEELASAHGSTLYRTLAALWAAHVTELADADHLVMGMPAMCRDAPGSDRMAGMFVTTLPLYVEVNEADTVSSLLRRTSEAIRTAGRHRHLPSDAVRELLDTRWDPRYPSRFVTTANLIHQGDDLPESEDGRWMRISVQVDPMMLDLGLRCYTKGADAARLVLRYEASLFEPATAERILGTFARLLRAVVDAPSDRVLRELQREVAQPTDDVPVHRHVSRVARDEPTSVAVDVAVDAGGRAVTYAELERRVNGLADELHAVDVGPGSFVGVHLERSLELIVAVLAIQRVGAGYVPLPVDLPHVRLELVIDDTTLAAIVSDRVLHLDERSVPVVRVDQPGLTTDAADALVAVDLDAPAYVIHTSGSTGHPKGALISQRSLATFTDVCRPLFGFYDTDRVLLFHSLAFDSSVEEIFCTLRGGGTVVVPPDDLLGSVAHFLGFVREHEVTLLVLPTSFWHVLVRDLEETDASLPPSLRLIIVGGQAADPGAVQRWLQMVPPEQVKLLNCYGPTEATVSVTSMLMTPEVMWPGEPTPIGRPHPGITARIADPEGRPVPDGELGELLLSGDQVGDGYLGRPDLTAERFVEHDGRRWYRTGDLVRLRSDGALSYHGRLDDQVKIRGFRIEPGEIEAALIDVPSVRDAYVLAEQVIEGSEPILVAHVTSADGHVLDPSSVRAALCELLPMHMVPSRVVLHDRLPRTAGGKPDRLALAAAEHPTVSQPARFGLTPAQTGLFVTELMRGDRAFQIVRIVHRCRGPLDVDAMQEAVRRVVLRHDALRARFDLDAGAPVQWVEADVPPSDVLTPLIDVSPAPDPEEARRDALETLLYAPFSVRGGALVRAALVRTDADEHTLALAVHHLVVDATSSAVLWGDLIAAYSALADGHDWQPEPMRTSYRAAVEERVATALGVRDRDLTFWQQLLDGAPARIPLPAADPPEPLPAVQWWELGAEVRQRLHEQAAAQRTTPFLLALTAFGMALRDVVGADDLVVGVPMNDRHLLGAAADGADDLVGLFVNTLPVRLRLPAGDSLADVMAGVRTSVLDAVAHGAVSVAELVQQGHRDRDRMGHAPFNVAVQLVHDRHRGPQALGPLVLERELWAARGMKFDLACTMALTNDSLRVHLDRAGDILGPALTERLINVFTSWLDVVLAVAPSDASVPTPAESEVAPPGGDLLADVLVAWRAAFDDPTYGVDADFFEAGGHSLLAVRLLSLLERSTGHDVPVLTLFDHPTPRALAHVLDPSVPVVRAETPRMPTLDAGPPRLHLDRAPLSFAQERFWLLRQLTADDLYQIPLAWRLVGRVDLATLQAALDAVVARHEILRTRYRTYDDGTPYQLIDPVGPVIIERFDVRGGDEGAVDRAWARLRRPFQLDEEWSLRVGVMEAAAQEHHLVLVVHHIAGDALIASQLWSDLRSAYRLAAVGEPADLPALPFQYADVAVWERARMTEAAEGRGEAAPGLAHWRAVIDELPDPVVLPRDEAADDPDRSVVVRSAPGAAAAANVRALAAQWGVTPTAVQLTAIGLVLTRLCARDELVVGVPVATRNAADRDLVGPFLNTLPVPIRVGATDTVADVARRVAADLGAVVEHRNVPFELLARQLATTGRSWDSALAPVVVNLFDGERSLPGGDLGGVLATPLGLPARGAHAARFGLTITVRLGVALELSAEHRAEVRGEVVESLLAAVPALVERLVADPTAGAHDVEVLDATRLEWLRHGLNTTRRPFPSQLGVDELVAEQIAARPREVAVVDGAGRTTYDVLDERAAGCARELERLDVQPGERVGLVLDRSTELVIWMLACARHGAVYVPVETSQPTARTEATFADSGVVAVVSRAPNGAVVAEARPRSEASSPLPRADQGGEAVYVMYTSGSTGSPKGVVVPHRAITRLVRGADYVQLGPDDVVAFASNPAFDAATWEVWGALANGATLVVLDRDDLLSPTRLRAALHTHGVTAMFITTALFNVLAAEQPDTFGGLRTLLFGGEACDAAAVRRVLVAGAPERLLHVYGPTESTTFACWHPVDQVSEHAVTLPIGLPVANTTAYVLDRHGRLVPPGVIGELYLGGEGLALGYLGDLALTAARFRPDPWAAVDGASLYGTGDLVRRRADGELEFVGRVDRQVKVRGYRVQPEEVEAACLAHPAVRAAVVEVESRGPSVELVAVIEASNLEAPALRAHLAEVLPPNMVPSSVFVVDALPVNANGKVDRAAVRHQLRSVWRDGDGAAEQAAVPGPDGPVARLWAEVLEVAAPDPDATFFELGGHSLRAVQLISRIRSTTGVDLPLSVLFEYPTLRSLDAHVRSRSANGDGGATLGTRAAVEETPTRRFSPPELVTLRAGTSPPLVLVHPAGGHLFRYSQLVAHLPEGCEVVGIAADTLPGARWPGTIEEVAASYVEAWRGRQPEGPYVLGGFSSGGVLAFEMARQLVAAGHEVVGLVLFDPTGEVGSGRGLDRAKFVWARFRKRWKPSAVKRRVRRRWRRLRSGTRVARRGASPTDVAADLKQHHRRMLTQHRAQPSTRPIPSLLVLAVRGRRPTQGVARQTARWRRLAGEPPEVMVVEGRHAGPGSFLEPPRVAEVAERLDTALHRLGVQP